MHYVKVTGAFLDSTIWSEPMPTKVTWMAMMLLADWDGNVRMPIPGLAKRAGVSLKECEEALEVFLSPDPYSTTPDKEGRRIEKIEGGWHLINHAKYKEMCSTEKRRAYKRKHSADYRARERERIQSEADRKALQDAGDGPPLATDDVEEFNED